MFEQADEDQTTAEDAPELEGQGGQAAQIDAAEGEEPTASGHDTDQYLTLSQVQEILAEAFVEYDRQAGRRQQSQLDKRDGKVQRWLTQQAAQIEALSDFAKQTLGLDDAAVQKLQGGLTKKVLDAVSDAGRRPARQQRQPFGFDDLESDEDADEDPYGGGREQQYDHDAVMSDAWGIWEKYGLENGDPEEALIATSGVSPQEYLRSIEYAGRLKKQRVGTQQKAPKPAEKASGGDEGDGKSSARAPAAAPGGKRAAGVNPIAKITDPSELYRLATEELDKKLRG